MDKKHYLKWSLTKGIWSRFFYAGLLLFAVCQPAFAIPTVPSTTPCEFNDSPPAGDRFTYPDASFTNQTILASNVDGTLTGFTGTQGGKDVRVCYYPTQPTSAPDSLCAVNQENASGTQYVALVNETDNSYCIYSYDINHNQADDRFNGAVSSVLIPPSTSDAKNIPIFGPLGLLFSILALLRVGSRWQRLN